jgi:predicted RNA binding protein YcfA (HicA-like mRNA interferase family)
MSTADKTLARMRQNPRDWRIEDLEGVAKRLGFSIRRAAGSHVTISATGCPTVVTVPAHKPVKPAYVRMFLRLVDEATEV